MKFFADHCVPDSVCRDLEDKGHEVLRLRKVIPEATKDSVVIQKAQELDAILISLNGDFSQIVDYPPSQFKGIISLKVRNRPSLIPDILVQLHNFFKGKTQEDFKGLLLVVEAFGVRKRTSP